MTKSNNSTHKKPCKTHATPARLAALEVVRQVRTRNAFAQDVIATVIDKSQMPKQERAFATLLALGCVSARGTLDEIINMALNSEKDIFVDTRDALQVSTYEIVFLKKEPHAAVDQGVELVRSFAPAACGVANAVLHKIVRLAPKFPFGNPSEDINAFARQYAFPTWLAQELVNIYDDRGVAEQFMKASNEQAPVYIGVNTCKTTCDEVIKAFKAAGEKLNPVKQPKGNIEGCFRLSSSQALLKKSISKLFDEGKILVCDAAAQYIVLSTLPDRKPKSILEIGAGRATKTILLQSGAMHKYGTQIVNYVAVDNHEYKIELLEKRTKTYDTYILNAITADACNLGDALHNWVYDFVFVDAPCTGLGTLRRHPEIRWRITPNDIDSTASLQLKMLLSAAEHVSSGGILVYSTCTVTLQENVEVVQKFLHSEIGDQFVILPTNGQKFIPTTLIPGSSDAHFAVRFVRV